LHKNCALFWSSDLIASVGQFVREVTLYWLAYEITGSALALGILGFCEAAPRLLFGAVGGVIVDRYDRLRLLTGIQFICCLPVLGLAILYFTGILAFWHITVLETLWATIRSMNPTAGQSMLRDLVPVGADERRVALLHWLQFRPHRRSIDRRRVDPLDRCRRLSRRLCR
jgi:MFS family permease